MSPGNNITVQFDIGFMLRTETTYYRDRFIQSECFADIFGITTLYNYESQAQSPAMRIIFRAMQYNIPLRMT
jgi:hypothetical protein